MGRHAPGLGGAVHSLVVKGWHLQSLENSEPDAYGHGEGHLEAGQGWLYGEGKSGRGSNQRRLPGDVAF